MVHNFFSKLSEEQKLSHSFKAGQALEIAKALHLMRTHLKLDCYSNLRIPIGQKYTSIDLLVVINNIILIAEMKNYTKSLEGAISDSYWIAASGFNYFSIPNPLKQNFYHCTSLASALLSEGVDTKHLIFKDYIIVPDSCDLRIPTVVHKYVMTSTDWDNYLLSFSFKKKQEELIKVLDKWRWQV